MNSILIHIPMIEYGEYDIFGVHNLAKTSAFVNEKNNGMCPNFGNRLWFQGLISEIQSQNNYIDYFNPTMSKDYINANYDFIIAPMANVFAIAYKSLLESLAEKFQGIKIPVYVIACGVQAESYDQLGDICEALKDSASKFISNVYNTGGEFALRGYFTKEFFERLGFSSAVVTGCPSLYQLGRNLKISDEKVSKGNFKPLVNGNPTDYIDLFNKYSNLEFFDQNTYYNELLDANNFDKAIADSQHLKKMIKKYGLDTTLYILQDRVKLIPTMNVWREYLIQNNFNFSYGSRIHGSIMPILAGVPAVLESQDARTKEMAEFFDIPLVNINKYRKYDSLYDLYTNTSYSKFNESFSKKFDAYENFLKKFGIVENINQNNQFFEHLDTVPDVSVNVERRKEILRSYEQKKAYWNSYYRLNKLVRKVKSVI